MSVLIIISPLQPPGNKNFELFHKDQIRETRKFKDIPLAFKDTDAINIMFLTPVLSILLRVMLVSKERKGSPNQCLSEEASARTSDRFRNPMLVWQSLEPLPKRLWIMKSTSP